MCPLDVQACFECPADLVGVCGVEGDGAERCQNSERRWVRQTVIRIKGLQIVEDRGAAKRNYDDNRLAGAGIASIQDGRQTVRI